MNELTIHELLYYLDIAYQKFSHLSSLEKISFSDFDNARKEIKDIQDKIVQLCNKS